MATHMAGRKTAGSAAHPPQVRNLKKVYGSRDGVTRALDGVSLNVDAGEFTAIMGPSGSGKSTLLNCVSTIDVPSAGSILIDGRDVSSLSQRQLADFRRRSLGYVFQDSNLLDALTARENIALPLTIGRVALDEIRARVQDVARSLGVEEVLDKYTYQMSGGSASARWRRRAAIVTRPRADPGRRAHGRSSTSERQAPARGA